MDKKEIINLTRDEVLKIPSDEREKIIRIRHTWIKKQRRTDKKYSEKQKQKIDNFKNKEKRREWYQKPENKGKIKQYNGKYWLKKKQKWKEHNLDFINMANFAKEGLGIKKPRWEWTTKNRNMVKRHERKRRKTK